MITRQAPSLPLPTCTKLSLMVQPLLSALCCPDEPSRDRLHRLEGAAALRQCETAHQEVLLLVVTEVLRLGEEAMAATDANKTTTMHHAHGIQDRPARLEDEDSRTPIPARPRDPHLDDEDRRPEARLDDGGGHQVIAATAAAVVAAVEAGVGLRPGRVMVGGDDYSHSIRLIRRSWW